jgi:adenylylsulfate kinase-like enzyme
LGFSDEDREENVRRVAETAKLCAGLGFVVLVSLITPRRSLRKLAAKIVGEDFHEVYLRAAFETCAERDPKGLYAKAKVGALKQFTGKDSGFEEPENECLTLDTEAHSAEECVQVLRDYLHQIMNTSRAG